MRIFRTVNCFVQLTSSSSSEANDNLEENMDRTEERNSKEGPRTRYCILLSDSTENPSFFSFVFCCNVSLLKYYKLNSMFLECNFNFLNETLA